MEKKTQQVINKEINFEEICGILRERGWLYFGKKKTIECPGLTEKEISYYRRTKKLPSPCDRCYKALIFWEGKFSPENLQKFLGLISLLDKEIEGKFNAKVVVFYFDDKETMLNFLSYLKNKLLEIGIDAKVQWRRACKEYQRLNPKLWKNAKELITDSSPLKPSNQGL